ncbi:MAG: flavodoxin family protein [Abditibacteriota bacterium]|nr:flavodoxin family protein [Abditibacteriota bacterium]
MKKIIAINAGPRKTWNTAQTVNAAAEGAKEAGAEVEVINLFDLKEYSGCVSCFGCKTEKFKGVCVCKDDLKPVLDKITEADGLIIGTPNYLGDGTASFRALYERLIFRSLTYNAENPCCNKRLIPVLFIMTSNMPDSGYEPGGIYHELIERYKTVFDRFVGPTEFLCVGDTLQVNDYSRYDWTYFDPEAKIKRHEEVFPRKLAEAKAAGVRITKGN